MRRHHPGLSCMTRAWIETKLPIEWPDYKKNGLKMVNIAYILQACESKFFTSKKLAYGICRWDMDLWHETFFEILAQAEPVANFTRNSPISRYFSPISRYFCMGKWHKNISVANFCSLKRSLKKLAYGFYYSLFQVASCQTFGLEQP